MVIYHLLQNGHCLTFVLLYMNTDHPQRFLIQNYPERRSVRWI